MPDQSQAEPSEPKRLTALRKSIERLLDSERLLPADGQALLEMLRRAEDQIANGKSGEAQGLFLGCESLLSALSHSGVVDRETIELCLVELRAAAEVLTA